MPPPSPTADVVEEQAVADGQRALIVVLVGEAAAGAAGEKLLETVLPAMVTVPLPALPMPPPRVVPARAALLLTSVPATVRVRPAHVRVVAGPRWRRARCRHPG